MGIEHYIRLVDFKSVKESVLQNGRGKRFQIHALGPTDSLVRHIEALNSRKFNLHALGPTNSLVRHIEALDSREFNLHWTLVTSFSEKLHRKR